MKLYQKILANSSLIASIGLSGCGRQTLEGTVKEEFGEAQRVVESRGAFSGNESVKIGYLTYGLIITNEQGEYTIQVISHFTKPIVALARAIEPGDRVRINYDSSTSIGSDKIGKTDSDTIEVIEKAKK